ncbi:hypothetical protein HKD37_06G016853 [Glycine soja]
MLRAIKNLDSMTLVILKVHEQEFAQDEGTKKGKLLALTTQRPKRSTTSKESLSKSLVVSDTLEEESDDDDSDEEDYELSLITRKVRKIWKNKNSSRFNGLSKRSFHKKEKSPIICYECKNPGHFNEEEANLCLIDDASTSKAKPALDASSDDEDSQSDDIVNSNCEEHKDLKEAHQVHLVDFVLETTSPDSAQDASICEKVKALLDEKVSNGHKTLLKDFQDLEEKGCEVLKELPLGIVKLYDKIENLRDNLGNLLVVMKPLPKLLKCKETPKTNLAMVSKAKRLYMAKKTPFVIFVEKWVMKLKSARTSLERETPQGVHLALTSTHMLTRPLDSMKETLVMICGQWLLTTHDMQNVYVSILKPYVWWGGQFRIESKRFDNWCR